MKEQIQQKIEEWIGEDIEYTFGEDISTTEAIKLKNHRELGINQTLRDLRTKAPQLAQEIVKLVKEPTRNETINEIIKSLKDNT